MSTREDRNFDPFHQRLKKNVYATVKGRLRLEILWRDLLGQIPQLESDEPLEILDAGAGMGNFSQRLLQHGHHLLLCDVSEKLLQEAQQNLASPADQQNVRFVQAPFQQLADDHAEAFDLVLSHAVLEWLAQPEPGIRALQQLIKPGGWLSLLFFNRNSLIYRHLLNGNFKKIRSGELSGEGKYLTPDNPLPPEQVLQWLTDSDLEIVCYSGIRTFVDFMHRDMRDKTAFDDLLEMELRFSRQEPFRSLARYLHVICRKP
jgi:S-adenosylmethionine-dependent methyltransferase